MGIELRIHWKCWGIRDVKKNEAECTDKKMIEKDGY